MHSMHSAKVEHVTSTRQRETVATKPHNTFLLALLAILLVAMAGAFAWSTHETLAYAKEIGSKNQQACEHCEAVRDGETPKDTAGNPYEKLLDGEVYRGGNAKSSVIENKTTYDLDNDPNDFAAPLPYGNVYVDTGSLSWSNPANFIIDIKDTEHFQWVAVDGREFKDATGTTTTTDDPLGSGKPLQGGTLDDGAKATGFIAYVGELKPYHDDITAVPDSNGFTNVRASDPNDPDDYLYRITYLNAATLADGTRGNVVMTMKRVEIETSITVDEDHPRVLTTADGTETYQYTKAVLPIQGANTLRVAAGVTDSEGNYVNEPNIVVKSREEVQEAIDKANAANKATVNKNLIPTAGDSSYLDEKVIRNTIGSAYTFDIEVQDLEGEPAVGTLTYSAKDLDLPSYQTNWGRERGSDPFMYAEGLSILDGTQSYALVPTYNHSNATTLETGWVPSGMTGSLDHPLNITGGSGSHADGVRFASIGEKVLRDKNGLWKDVLFGGPATSNPPSLLDQPTGTIMDFSWDNINNSRVRYKDLNELWDTWVNDSQGRPHYKKTNIRRELAGKIPDGSGGYKPWDQITIQDIAAYFEGGSYSVERNDNGFDSGFAVLINPGGSTLRWTGSSYQSGSAVSNIFDSSIFTYIEQTHGTGGGIYLETYTLASDCDPTPSEGVVTMGKGADATVTAVPEEGYRIKRFLIGGKGLSSPKEYTLDSLGLTPGTPATVEQDGIKFEMNADGTVDVTFKDVQDPRHIHVDFTADYYFYKIWKGNEEPTKLNMTAVPYAYIFTDVTLPVQTGIDAEGHAVYTDTHFSINGTNYTADDGTKYVLNANNTLETVDKDAGGNPLVTLPQVLTGNSFVGADDTEYPVIVQFGVNFAMGDGATEASVKKTFTVDDTSAYTSDGYVTVLPKGNEISRDNIVWKIKYPAQGVSSLGWPELAIETEPDKHNVNHVERNYWFTTEEVPGWAKESYSNKKAEAPGVVPQPDSNPTYYDDHVWAAASKKDYDAAKQMIQVDNETKNAYMSVFSKDAGNTTEDTWGGEITNIPSVVVKATKNWEDFKNGFKTRQDIWLHLDAKIGDTTTKDILPPQKLAAGTAETESVTWGDKKVYDTNQDKVKIIKDLSEIPLQDENGRRITYSHASNGSYPASNKITYWLNELVKVDSNGNTIEYTIRETLDAAGNESVEAGNEAAGLVGYKADADNVTWDNMDKNAEKTEIGEGDNKVEVPTYEGELTNKLAVVDFTITKIWKENGANRTHTLDADVAKLKAALTLNESDKKIADTDVLKVQPSTAAEYVADPESGTLETKNGDETEVVFTWHNIPKYVGGEEDSTPHEAVYSVVETPLSGYNAPQYSSDGKALDEGTITNEVTPPEGTDRETYGPKNTPQSTDGKSMFEVTTSTALDGSPNKIEKVELLDAEGNPATSVTVPEGTYIVDESGKITFTPNDGFVGDPTPVQVRGTDSNGLSAEAEYQPHIIDNEKTVTRTITYEYSNGDPVLDSEGNPKTVVHTTTFTGSVDPNTGEVTYPGDPTDEFPQVDSDPIEGYTPDKDKVDKKTVTPSDSDWAEKVIYSPKGVTATPDETYGLPGESQTGTVSFTMETETYTDGTPNKLTVKLIDPATGEETDEKTVSIPGQGTYTLNENGTITFTPEDGYVGNPDPIEVTGTDRFGTKAKTTYTPHIVDPTSQDTAKRTIHFTYLTEDGEEVTEDVVQELTLTRHAASVDPKTGEVLEWGPWEPQTFPAVSNPDDKVDGKIWSTDDSADALEVTEPGDKGVVNIVYYKEPYTVIYHDGDHGKSDGKGDQSGEEYDSDVTGGNGVTPSTGYKFTGTYTYIIKDKEGNVIDSGTTDDPTSLKVIGNIEFTPVYEKLPTATWIDPATGRVIKVVTPFNEDGSEPTPPDPPTRPGYNFDGWDREVDADGNVTYKAKWTPQKYTIKYDANGGSGTMDSQSFTGEDNSATSKTNSFTREGYYFTGFKAMLPDGTYVKDENGNDRIFTSTGEFMAYFHEYGDGSEITLIAQWEPVAVEEEETTPAPKSKPSGTSTGSVAKKASGMLARTSDTAPVAPLATLVLSAAGILVFSRRRAQD